MTELSGIERVRAYYEALNGGDAAAVSSHFTEDAVHLQISISRNEFSSSVLYKSK